jgi:hypothetical protein
MGSGNRGGKPRSDSVRAGIAGVGVVVLTVVCCAAAPIALALAGTLTAAAILGASAGLGALAIVGGLALAIRHRRHACEVHSSKGRRG